MLPGGRAASPLPGGLPGAEGLLLAPQPWRGSGGYRRAKLSQADTSLFFWPVGTASLQIPLGFCAVTLLGRSTLVQGWCSLPTALPFFLHH